MAEADAAADMVSAPARSPKLLVERARKSFRQASGAEISAIADLSFSMKSGMATRADLASIRVRIRRRSRRLDPSTYSMIM